MQSLVSVFQRSFRRNVSVEIQSMKLSLVQELRSCFQFRNLFIILVSSWLFPAKIHKTNLITSSKMLMNELNRRWRWYYDVMKTTTLLSCTHWQHSYERSPGIGYSLTTTRLRSWNSSPTKIDYDAKIDYKIDQSSWSHNEVITTELSLTTGCQYTTRLQFTTDRDAGAWIRAKAERQLTAV